VPLLVQEGHEVAGMTRSVAKADSLRAAGATPVICDVYDLAGLTAAVEAFEPEMVMHQLTDLPDSIDDLGSFSDRNDRMRTEGTRNLVTAAGLAAAAAGAGAAAAGAGAPRFLAQSIAWRPPGRGDVVDEHERLVLDAGGIVVQYGQLYGPGTFYEDGVPDPPRIHVDEAARRTVPLLEADSGVVVLAED
jgi:hypothetical protein